MQQQGTPAQNPPNRRAVSVRLPTIRPRLTYVLLGAIVAVFVVQFLYLYINDTNTEPITEWGALIFDRVLHHGEYYRLFTSMFLHVNEVHLLFNGLNLYFFGRSVEAFFGRARFGAIYILGGLAGSLTSFIFTRGNSVGASGAIFAVIGAEMVFLYLNRKLLGKAALDQFRWLIIMAGITFAIGIVSTVNSNAIVIDNWGHVGGLVAGVILAWFICPQYKIVADTTSEAGVRIADATLDTQWWLVPVIFAAALAGLILYAVTNLR